MLSWFQASQAHTPLLVDSPQRCDAAQHHAVDEGFQLLVLLLVSRRTLVRDVDVRGCKLFQRRARLQPGRRGVHLLRGTLTNISTRGHLHVLRVARFRFAS